MTWFMVRPVPRHRAASLKALAPEPIAPWVVQAREVNPPPGVKEPIDWVLLTSRPVRDLEGAMEVISYYEKRESLARLPGLEANRSGINFVFSCRNHLTGALRLARTRRIPARPHRGHHPHRGPAHAPTPQAQPQLPAAALPTMWPQRLP